MQDKSSGANGNGVGHSSSRKLFDTVTLMLALLAIVFAVIQFLDSHKQLDKAREQMNHLNTVTASLRNISGSLQGVARAIETKYVGSFPENMDAILDVVGNVPEGGELDIMTDFAGYAIYSRHAMYEKYLSELRSARTNKNVREKILVYDKNLAAEALRKQFSQEAFELERKHGFRRFFEHIPPEPATYDEFLGRILALLEHSISEMCTAGIEVRRVPESQKYLFFLWSNRRPQAVFAFRNESVQDRELSFTTVQPELANVFQILFDNTWAAVDPNSHTELLNSMEPACRALSEPDQHTTGTQPSTTTPSTAAVRIHSDDASLGNER